MKKATAKYCSVRCCTLDPERLQRLRAHARRGSAKPLPMAYQLSLSLQMVQDDPEAQLSRLGSREDIPGGMSRLAG